MFRLSRKSFGVFSNRNMNSTFIITSGSTPLTASSSVWNAAKFSFLFRNLLVKFTFFVSQEPCQGVITSYLETLWIQIFSRGRYPNIPLRESFWTTWPDHFLKAADGPVHRSISSSNHSKQYFHGLSDNWQRLLTDRALCTICIHQYCTTIHCCTLM